MFFHRNINLYLLQSVLHILYIMNLFRVCTPLRFDLVDYTTFDVVACRQQIEYQQLASLSSSILFTYWINRTGDSIKLISYDVLSTSDERDKTNRGRVSSSWFIFSNGEVDVWSSTHRVHRLGIRRARYFPAISINDYAARLREGRAECFIASRPRISSVCAGSITIFRYPIHFTLRWAKRRASGRENLRRARARALAKAERAPGDRDALLSKLHLPCALSHMRCAPTRRTQRDGNNLNPPAIERR